VSAPTVEFSFHVSGYDFLVGDTLAIFFDQDIFTNLVIPFQTLPDWSLLVFQPDLGLPAPGEFDLTAVVDHASLANPFLVDADLLPGQSVTDRPFSLYAGGNFATAAEQGTATAFTPEPASILTAALGLIAALALRRRS
jgi:hypothetical protein